MALDWGRMAGGAQDALQQLLEQRMLEEQMALAQRRQAAEEQHRAATLGETRASREQQQGQFDKTFGQDVRKYDEVEVPESRARTGFTRAQTARTEQTTAQEATAESERQAASADIMADPKLAPVLKGVRAGFRAPGAEDPTGEVERSFTAGERAKDRGATIAAAGIRASASGSQRPMTQGQRAALSAGLRKDYNANVKGARTIATQVQMMNEGFKNYDVNPNAASQAVLVTFQKILDPTSVVRESEYARTFDGQALLDRMQGALEKWSSGGAGVTKEQLAGFKELADRFAAGYAQKAREYQSVIDANADEFGIDKSLIYSGSEFDGADTLEPSGGPAVGTERTINGVPAVWDGRGWKKK